MPAKQLSFGDEARERIRRSVDTLAEAVKVTLGPHGRSVILQPDDYEREQLDERAAKLLKAPSLDH